MRAHATPTSTSIASRSSRAPRTTLTASAGLAGARQLSRVTLQTRAVETASQQHAPRLSTIRSEFEDLRPARPGRRCHPGEPDPAKHARAAFPHSYITLNEIDVGEPTWFLDLDGVHFDEARSRRRPTGADRGARPDRPSAASRTPSRPTRGHFTTIRANFDLPAGVRAPQTYVHHSHIVEHEDNDMMRPFTVMA
jgi:hypothetical protein